MENNLQDQVGIGRDMAGETPISNTSALLAWNAANGSIRDIDEMYLPTAITEVAKEKYNVS